MARILFINSVCHGSTGNICKNLYKLAENVGHECCIAYGRGDSPEGFNYIKIGANIDVYSHVIKSRLTDRSGFGSGHATKKFVKWIDDYKPDIIHLHNIHGYYINIQVLFSYLKEHPEIKKIWTLHDCWTYTGHCAYYLSSKCYKWQKECSDCKYINEYPKAIIDNSKKNFEFKKSLFTQIKNMHIVCVSEWMRGEVDKSFMNVYPLSVITSGIDTKIFSNRKSDFKKSKRIEDKKIILGVASVWENRKGLSDFIKLNELMDEKYVIVLIGLNEKQIKSLPKGIIGLSRTENAEQLAEIYSAATVFFNPTKEETFGLTNVEAQACGTAVVSYNAGGTKETLVNSNTFLVNNLEEFVYLLEEETFNKETNNLVQSVFEKDLRMSEYLELYNEGKK